MQIEGLDEFITQFPVFEYRIVRTEKLSFEERVRQICRQECDRYGTTWACPPAVGTVEERKERCLAYSHGLLFSSVAEVSDIMNMQELLDTRMAHESITDKIGKFLQAEGYEVFILSTESCDICEHCTYPDAPCCNPGRMHPCLESHGIVVTDIVEAEGMEYNLGGNTILWFSMILVRGQA